MYIIFQQEIEDLEGERARETEFLEVKRAYWRVWFYDQMGYW